MQDEPDQGEKKDSAPDTEASVHDESVIIQERSQLTRSERTELRERPTTHRELEPISREEGGPSSESEETDQGDEPVTQKEDEPEVPEETHESEKEEEQTLKAETPVAATPPKTSLAEDMTNMTSTAAPTVASKKLSSLPFPWFRATLVGLAIPLVTIALIALADGIIGQPLTLGAMTTVTGWMVAVPVIAGLVVVAAAAWLLKRMDVGRAFFLSLGTLICSAGMIVLTVNEFYPVLAEVGWGTANISQSDVIALSLLSLVGAVVILILIFVVHTLGRYLPKVLTAFIFLLIVSLPWLVHFYGDDIGVLSQKSDIIPVSADVA